MSTKSHDDFGYDFPALLEAQDAFFRAAGTRSIAFRKEALQSLGTELEARSDDILAALATDLGKPALEAYVSEVYFSLAEIRLFVKRLARWSRPRRVRMPFYYWPGRSEIRREPFGKAVIVAPWNYPVQLALGPLIAAVAAGNTVVLKLSEHAPATADLLAEIVEKVFEPGHVAVVLGGPEVGKQLLDQSFDTWFYTGNEKVGRLYAAAAAKHLAPVTLELGGKCPCFVDENVDLDLTVERIIATKFFNAGQTCVAPDFVLVPKHLEQVFTEKAKVALEENYGSGASRDLACIVNDSHFRRVRDLIGEGAIRIGSDDPERNFLAPTLIPDADWECPSMQDEIFGPVLPVVGYTSMEDAIDRLAEMPSPLALYVFSRDRAVLEHVASSIPSGSVCFNDVIKQATNLQLPFGGVAESGMGRYRGRAGFETFSYERAVTRRWFLKDPFLIKPPYSGKLKNIRKLLK